MQLLPGAFALHKVRAMSGLYDWELPLNVIESPYSGGYWAIVTKGNRMLGELREERDAKALAFATNNHEGLLLRIDELVKERDAALARAQAAEANDRRYRWLRDGNARDIAERWDFGGSEEGFQALKIAVQVFGEDWDAAIDSALSAQSDAKKEGVE